MSQFAVRARRNSAYFLCIIRRNSPTQVERIRIFGKQGWGIDPANIKCPCFIYHPELDAEIPKASNEHHHKNIPGSELIVWPGLGHSTIVYKAPEIILALVQGKAATPS